MKFTEHALKRFDILMADKKALREIEFMHKFILPGYYTIPFKYGLNLRDVTLFAERCEAFNVRFLGMETHMDSPYSFHVICREDYDEKVDNWYLSASKRLSDAGINGYLIPSIDISDEDLHQYLS